MSDKQTARTDRMELGKVIRKLYEERIKLDKILASLEQLERSTARVDKKAPKKRPGRKSMDAQARQEVSERMKKYWAGRRQRDGNGPAAV